MLYRYLRHIFKIPLLGAELGFEKNLYSKLIEDALVYGNPEVYAVKVGVASIAVAILVPWILYLAGLPILLVVALGAGLYWLPKALLLAYLYIMRYRRVKGVEEEFPLLAMYLSTMGSLGINVTEALRSLLATRELRYIVREVEKVFRDAMLFYGDVLLSLERNSRNHPSKTWHRYFMGMLSVMESGGDLAKYFEEKMKEQLNVLKSRWIIYSERASDWGELIIGTFLLSVALVLISTFIVPSDAYTVLGLLAMPTIPMLSLAILTVMETLLPPTRNRVEVKPLLPLLSAVAVFLILMMESVKLWAAVAVSALAFAAYNGALVWRQLRELREEERWLPVFLRSLIDVRRMGLPLDHAISRLRGFGWRIDSLLDEVAAQLKMGKPLNAVRVRCRSWLLKTTFFVVGNIAVYGGGSPAVLERVYGFVTDVQDSVSLARSRMRLYAILAALAPVITSLMLSVTFNLARAYVTMPSFMGANPINLQTDFSGVLSLSKLVVVEAAIALGLTVSKARSFTVRDTRLLAVNIAIAVLSLILMDRIAALVHLGL